MTENTIFFGEKTSNPRTWRIIQVSKWLITMVNKSPKDRVVDPVQMAVHSMAKINGGVTIRSPLKLTNWDDPLQKGFPPLSS